jgi:hypothetical protein
MPTADWTALTDIPAAAVPPPPFTVAAAWTCAAAIMVTATRLSVQDAMPSRVITGLTHTAGDKARYKRGTYGLMPDEWGVIEEAQLADSGAEFEKADGHAKIYAAGVATTVYRLQLAIRMPSDRKMPEKGEQFQFAVRGESLTFTVWSGVTERWSKNGIRLVDVPARHYADMPNAVPREVDDLEVPQDIISLFS